MIVISDSNIIFSCFYSPNGVLASILKEKKNRLQFIAPDFLLEEIEEHLPEILKNTKLTKKQAKALLKDFTQNITFFKLEIYFEYFKDIIVFVKYFFMEINLFVS